MIDKNVVKFIEYIKRPLEKSGCFATLKWRAADWLWDQITRLLEHLSFWASPLSWRTADTCSPSPPSCFQKYSSESYMVLFNLLHPLSREEFNLLYLIYTTTIATLLSFSLVTSVYWYDLTNRHLQLLGNRIIKN